MDPPAYTTRLYRRGSYCLGEEGQTRKKRGKRCGVCEQCVRGNCGECGYCRDMKKFGGKGKLKQACGIKTCENAKFRVANHLVVKWMKKKFKVGSEQVDTNSGITRTLDNSCTKNCDSQGSANNSESEKMGKEGSAIKPDSCTITAVISELRTVSDNSVSDEPTVKLEVGSEQLPVQISPTDEAVIPPSLSPTEKVFCPKELGNVDKCEACGTHLAFGETLMEHVVSVHLTIEGLCDICGEDSWDFIEHFKIHLS
eukprot:GFUD01039731.1.p1 GENE.GFUD01039731.1~~GFUD01039731.1.p1  ORF type:complete len:255 (-),score=62.35 GFUD01039731.1:236-1000(-)